MSIPGHLLAVVSTCLYFSGLIYFKMAATGMPPLRGYQPWRLARELLGDRTWIAGAALLGVGAYVQVVTLSRLSVCQAQRQIALQRSRLVIVALVATATAKTYLFIMATALYREPWPGGHGRTALVLALALSVLAIAAVPHHERPAGPAPRCDGPFARWRSA